MANLGLGQGKYSMNLKHLMYQRVLKKKKKEDVDISKGHRSQKHLQCSKLGQCEQQKYCIIRL